MLKINIEEVRQYIESVSPSSKIYIGCDSERFRKDGKWVADYTLAIVIHIDGKHGGKVFGEVQREPDYQYEKKNKPRMRLMTEVYKISELYLKLKDILEDRDVEVHLDLNPEESCGSSCVINEAIGYIRGVCNVTPIVKPDAWAASSVADRLKFIMNAA